MELNVECGRQGCVLSLERATEKLTQINTTYNSYFILLQMLDFFLVLKLGFSNAFHFSAEHSCFHSVQVVHHTLWRALVKTTFKFGNSDTCVLCLAPVKLSFPLGIVHFFNVC